MPSHQDIRFGKAGVTSTLSSGFTTTKVGIDGPSLLTAKKSIGSINGNMGRNTRVGSRVKVSSARSGRM